MNLKKWMVGVTVLLCLTIGTTAFAKNNPESINTAKADPQTSQSQQIYMLEQALAASSPEAAVATWAKGVKVRNGAMQYAVMTESLRKETKQQLEELNWVTGTSSPWVKSYSVSKGKKVRTGVWSFTVDMIYTDSTKSTYKERWSIQTVKQQNNWYVSNIVNHGEAIGSVPGEARITYVSKKFRFSMELPSHWAGKYIAREKKDKVELLFKSKTGDHAPIISFYKVPVQKWEQDPYGQLHKLAEKNGNVFFYVLPLDNPFSEHEVAEYARMVNDVKVAMRTFKFLQ